MYSKLHNLLFKLRNKEMFKHESNTTILPQGLLSSPLNRNWFPIVSTRDHLGMEMEFMLGTIHKLRLLKGEGKRGVKSVGIYLGKRQRRGE